MSEHIIELPDSGAADEFVAKMGVDDCRIYGYRLSGEIVRCRDCAYYDDEPDLESSTPECWRDPEHRGTAVWTRPDGFCAWGEIQQA